MMPPDFAQTVRSPGDDLDDVTECKRIKPELLEPREQFREWSAYMEAIPKKRESVLRWKCTTCSANFGRL